MMYSVKIKGLLIALCLSFIAGVLLSCTGCSSLIAVLPKDTMEIYRLPTEADHPFSYLIIDRTEKICYALIVEKSESGTPVEWVGYVVMAEDGEGYTVALGDHKLPRHIYMTNGSVYDFNNWTAASFDVVATHSAGADASPRTVSVPREARETVLALFDGTPDNAGMYDQLGWALNASAYALMAINAGGAVAPSSCDSPAIKALNAVTLRNEGFGDVYLADAETPPRGVLGVLFHRRRKPAVSASLNVDGFTSSLNPMKIIVFLRSGDTVDALVDASAPFRAALEAEQPEPGPYSPRDDSMGGLGALAGRVTDAVTSDPLGGVAVLVSPQDDSDAVADRVMTDDNGQFYSGNLPPGPVRITFEKEGYLPAFQNALVAPDVTTQITNTLMVPDTGESAGNASGQVIDAVSGLGLDGVNLVLRPGILPLEDDSGETVATTTTDAAGHYAFTRIPAGIYTAFADRSGYVNNIFPVFFVGGQTHDDQNGTMSPDVDEGEIRIILTWGATPYDLDSHLIGPSSSGRGDFHLYFPSAGGRSPEPAHISLDLDDTRSYGPETTTIYVRYPGTYRFLVHDYSNAGSRSSVAMSNSGANVQVISASGTREFNIHPNTVATLWAVFEIDGQTGAITPVNQYHSTATPSR